MSKRARKQTVVDKAANEDSLGSALDNSSDDHDDSDDPTYGEQTKVKKERAAVPFNIDAITWDEYSNRMPEDQLKTILDTVPDMGPCTLTSDQLIKVRRTISALEKSYPVHMIRSEPGAGKTIATYAVAKQLNLAVVVIRPTRVTSWRAEAARTNSILKLEMGYEGLRSIRGNKTPKHGLLTREDPPTPPPRGARGAARRRRRRSEEEDEEESEVEEEEEEESESEQEDESESESNNSEDMQVNVRAIVPNPVKQEKKVKKEVDEEWVPSKQVKVESTSKQVKVEVQDSVLNPSTSTGSTSTVVPPPKNVRIRFASTGTRKRRRRPLPIFTPTDKFKQMLREGILLVLDESHRVKNASERTAAMSALVNAVVDDTSHRSRCVVLSGTAFDQIAQVRTVSQLLGLIPHAKGAVPEDCRLVKLGRLFAPEHKLMAPRVLSRLPLLKGSHSLLMFVYKVFVHIISPRLSSATPKLVVPAYMDARIGFYQFPLADEFQIRKAMRDVDRAVNTPGRNDNRLAQITSAVESSHMAKVRTVCRLVRAVFKENRMAQVAVMGNFKDSLFAIASELRDLFPVVGDSLFIPELNVLTGEMTAARQEQVVDQFQAGTCPILIANLDVGGEGLNLQDRIGTRQRYVFILPSHRATSMMQGFYRFFRMDTKSDVVIRVVMCRSKNSAGEDVVREQCLLENHKRKDRVWRDLMPQQDLAGAQWLAGLEWFREEQLVEEQEEE